MFENKTVDDVYELFIEQFKQQFGSSVRLLPKSFLNVLAKICAGVFVILYKVSGWCLLQQYPDTASFETVNVLGHSFRPLVMLGNQFGAGEPKSASAFRAKVRVKAVSAGRTLMAGTQLKCDDNGILYLVEENTVIGDAENVVLVRSAEYGTAGNLKEGALLKFASPLGFVECEAEVIEVVEAGEDDESEASYRQRVKNGYTVKTQGGALYDYRVWAKDVSGVKNVYVYKDSASPAGVLIYVEGLRSMFPDRTVSRGVCEAVGKACTYDVETGKASRKPLGAVIDPDADESYKNVKPCLIVKFNVVISGVSGTAKADFESEAKAKIEEYFFSRFPFIRGCDSEYERADSISRNALIAIVNGVAERLQVQFSSVALFRDSKEIESYMLGDGELAALSLFSIS